MRLKDLFTVPNGQKVTEKHLRRVLISSICSILLCMTCLVSTTWAWFAVSIENTGNEIQIATVTPIVEIKKDDVVVSPVDASYTLDQGTYTVNVRLDNDATESDDLHRTRGKAYVVMIVTHNDMSKHYFFTFDGTQGESKALNEFQISSGTAVVNFSVSWVKPVSAASVDSEPVVIGEIPTEPSTEPTTTPSTEPSTETTISSTEPSTEATTAPTTA